MTNQFSSFLVRQLLGQRLYGLALGYEELNDHQHLRLDPLLAAPVRSLIPWARTDLIRRGVKAPA